MTALLIVWLVSCVFVLCVALVIDLRPRWLDPHRLVNWPFGEDMPATNAVVFMGVFFTALIGLILLLGTKGLGWI